MKPSSVGEELSVEELKEIQLSILDEIDRYCQQEGISYYLYYGTLIGAVRHQGYIPWDDDVDICMMRSDYERFFRHFNDRPHNGKRAIDVDSYEGYYLPFGKVIDTGTVLLEKTNFNVPIGVYVDVFPLDALPDEDKEVQTLNRKIKRYRDMLALKTISSDPKRAFWKNAILKVSAFVLRPFSVKRLIRRIDSLSQFYRDDRTCNHVGAICLLTYGLREVLPSAFFSPGVPLTFERGKYNAPKNYDGVLRSIYGDYMQLPPEEKRVTHHGFTAYRIAEKEKE